jgi:outer membrane protein assembly factor BamA
MLSTFYDKFPFYYGVGSYSIRDQDLVEQGYNRTDFFTTRSKLGLERAFLRKSSINIYALYEYNSVKPAKATSIFNTPAENDIKGLGKTHLGGIELGFNLDFRDNPHFTKNGSLLTINNKSCIGKNTSNTHEKTYLFTKAEIAWAQYQTFNIGTELTLMGRTGILTTFGNAPFYHQTVLGSNSYLRGYTRNRFLDDYAAFYNLEARIHIGTVQTVLAPLRFGLFGFFDNGIVWGEKRYKDNRWNNAKGLGLYIAPIADLYNINFYFAKSKDKGIYSDYRIGWRF